MALEHPSACYPSMQPSYRLTATLLEAALPFLIEASQRPKGAGFLANCLGCDCDLISQSLAGCRPTHSVFDSGFHGPMTSIFIAMSKFDTKAYPIYEGKAETAADALDCFLWAEFDDFTLLSPRIFEPNIGYGVKWLPVSREELKEVIEELRSNK